MKNLIAILISTFLIKITYASNFEQRMKEAYQRQHTHQEIFCTAPGLKLLETVRLKPNEITSIHELDGQIVSISLDVDANFILKTDTGILIKGEDAGRNKFDFIEPEENSLNFKFYQKYKLAYWLCRAGTYFDKPIVIDQSKTHIVVHPHPFYDQAELATPYIEKKLQDSSFRHILLLDNFSKNVTADIAEFIRGMGANDRRQEQFTAPNFLIPDDVELFGASAGWSHFKFKTDQANITFTGGNLNYCMHNSTNFLIDAFLQYNTQGKLNINYDMNGILAQKDGLVGPDFIAGGYFSRQYVGFFVKDYFAENLDDEEEFHEEWFEFLVEEKLKYRKYFFKTIHLVYQYKGKVFQATISGLGEGEFEISLNFI